MKKRIIIILITIIALLSVIYIINIIIQKKEIKKIKKSFNNYITINKDTNIYNEKKEIIGTATKNAYFELENTKIKTKNDTYFKINGTNYYIYYKDIDKTEQKQEEKEIDYYIKIGKKIITNETTNFYQNNIHQFSINNSFEFEANKRDENYYYITYLNQTYQIKKDDIKEEIDIELDNKADYISVLNYNKIEEKCNEENCVTIENFKEQLDYIKDNNYYTINIEDYQKWLKDEINLKENAILITSKQENINNLIEEYNLKIEQNFDDLTYIDTNSKSQKNDTNIPRYNIINKTTIDIFEKILKGENITYIEEKTITQTHTLPDSNEKATKIAVLNYHFFYNEEGGETCGDGNCKRIQDFEKELKYLQDNNYKTLTIEEFTKWMYNEIELPARSVLITIDDGAQGTGTHNGNKLIPLLEKYKTHATLFLISGWWPKENYSSEYLDIESHTYDMHEGNYCSEQPRGSKLLCSSREQILKDLSKSAEILGSKNAFCFPLYVYNETTLSVLKEIGFKVAFIGGDTKATRDNNKYLIPRYHIYRETTLAQFINMIS